MNVDLRTPSRSERSLIRRMMELYLHDFSEFDGTDLDEHGQFGYGDLDYFWFEPTHAAFLVTVDNNLAGFVLVDKEVVLDDSERSITEFFVLRKYRRPSNSLAAPSMPRTHNDRRSHNFIVLSNAPAL